MIEIKLRAKYTSVKPVKQQKSGSGHAGQSKHKVSGPKGYVYGSRVRMVDALTGHSVMVAANPEDHKR